jgi:hypothetical protein
MQCIFAYSNLGDGYQVKFEADGSSHGFSSRGKNGFTMDHNMHIKADVIIEPVIGHWLDYFNNQYLKSSKGDTINTVKTMFPDYKHSLIGYWEDINAPWAMREWTSFWLYDVMQESYKHVPHGCFNTRDLFTKNVFPNLINRLGLTLTADDATMKHNQSNWIAQQRYHNSQLKCDRWVQDILEDKDSVSPCQTMFDEAYVQHCLREHGYEIRCDGLDVFPTNSRDLRELIYENCDTNNK